MYLLLGTSCCAAEASSAPAVRARGEGLVAMPVPASLLCGHGACARGRDRDSQDAVRADGAVYLYKRRAVSGARFRPQSKPPGALTAFAGQWATRQQRQPYSLLELGETYLWIEQRTACPDSRLAPRARPRMHNSAGGPPLSVAAPPATDDRIHVRIYSTHGRRRPVQQQERQVGSSHAGEMPIPGLTGRRLPIAAASVAGIWMTQLGARCSA